MSKNNDKTRPNPDAQKKAKDAIQLYDKAKALQQKRYQEVAVFADGQDYNRDRYIRRLRKAAQTAVFANLEVGRCLIVLKQMEGHGDFLAALEQVGITERTARRYIAVTKQFYGFDDDFVREMGTTKLYTLLAAPQAEVENLKQDGEFMGKDKEELVAMSKRDLEEYIKREKEKLKFKLQQEKDAKEKLLDERTALKKERDDLQKRVRQLATGEKPADPLPSWWGEYNNFIGATEAFAHKLAKDPPNLDDELMLARCQFLQQRIERELAFVWRWLRKNVVDPVEFKDRTREKLAEIENSGKFDFSAFDQDFDED